MRHAKAVDDRSISVKTSKHFGTQLFEAVSDLLWWMEWKIM